jgi:phytoene synthase
MNEAARAYCQDLVRQADKDRFLAALFAPDAARPRLLALYAFNIEIARVRESVSEPALGEIRLRWWHDTIAAIYRGETPDHPVGQELAEAIAAADLPMSPFINLIESRRFDLYDDPMPSLVDLEGYLGETSSALIQLAALILAGRAATASAEAAGLAGVAFGIVGLLRALPVHRSRGQSYLPIDMLERHGVAPADVLAARDVGAFVPVLLELCSLAEARLAEARRLIPTIPKEALTAFLTASLTDLYLAKLRSLGPRMLTTPAEVSQLRRQWRLYLSASRNKF